MENFNKTKLSNEIQKVVNSGLKITSNDEEFEKLILDSNISWDDLNTLKEEIGEKTMEFIHNVTQIITNNDIIGNLGDKKEEFNSLTEIFFRDITDFSHKIKALSSQHENKSGSITSLDDYDVYNRLSIQYHALVTELLSVAAPTLSELILISSSVLPEKDQKAQNEIKNSEEEKSKGVNSNE